MPNTPQTYCPVCRHGAGFHHPDTGCTVSGCECEISDDEIEEPT